MMSSQRLEQVYGPCSQDVPLLASFAARQARVPRPLHTPLDQLLSNQESLYRFQQYMKSIGAISVLTAYLDLSESTHPHTLTSSHPHTLTSSHPYILTPSHHHTLTSSQRHTFIVTPSYPHTLTPSHPHALTQRALVLRPPVCSWRRWVWHLQSCSVF